VTIKNGKWVRIMKEAAAVYFKTLFQRSSGESDETHQTLIRIEDTRVYPKVPGLSHNEIYAYNRTH
jgi:hypothetical protein